MSIQYYRTVGWDSTLIDVEIDSNGLVVNALKITTGAPAATAGYFEPGAIVQNIFSGVIYKNSGTTVAPSWYTV